MRDETISKTTAPPLRASLPRTLLRLAMICVFVWLTLRGLDWLMYQIMELEESAAANARRGILITALVGYALLIAVPFMPGIEIGIAILAIEGASAAPFVYLATLTGLLIAFAVGQRVSLDWLQRVFRDLHMMRACQLLDQIKSQPLEARLNALTHRLPIWLSKPLIDYRYVTIALLVNLPGNVVIGGGGGIMLLAGLTRLFHGGWMMLTIAIAVLPVPFIVWIMGRDVLV